MTGIDPTVHDGLDDVHGDPFAVAERLAVSGEVYGLTEIEVRLADDDMVVFWLTLEPWAPMAERGYPTERISLTVWPAGLVTAVAAPSGRAWYHVYPRVLGDLSCLGQLCLWYPGDPPGLRWEWDDGLVAFITIAHRHLQAEEYYRRNQTWPAEDAPHGSAGDPGTPRPLGRSRQKAA